MNDWCSEDWARPPALPALEAGPRQNGPPIDAWRGFQIEDGEREHDHPYAEDDETADVPMVAVRAQGEPLFGAQAYNHARTRAQIRGLRAELRDGPCNGGRYGEP